MMRKLVGLGIALLFMACGRGDGARAARPATIRRASAPYVAPRDTVPMAGVYQRDRDEARFQICGVIRIFRVTAGDSVMALLDANVDWHAERPTTTMYAVVGGDTIPGGRDAMNAGLLAIATVDTMRGVDKGECAPHRPLVPPATAREVVAATIRAALGADSALAIPANYRNVSVWLDRDLHPDLLVLVRAPSLCELAGCTLFIFQGTADGYQLVGRTRDVVVPIQVRRWPTPTPEQPDSVQQEMTEGRVDLQVKVNGGAFGLRDAILRYRDGRYPRNAAFEPPPGGRRGLAAANGTTVLP